MDETQNKPQQPTNTPVIGLARAIPQYRQAKLAGQKYPGPIRNAAPIWSQINTTTLPRMATGNAPTIKGQSVIGNAPTQTPEASTTPNAPKPITTQSSANASLTTPTITPSPAGYQISSTPPAATTAIPPSTVSVKPQPALTAVSSPTNPLPLVTLSAQSDALVNKLKSKEAELKALQAKSTDQQKHLGDLTNQKKTAEAIIQNLKQQVENLKQHPVDQNQIQELTDKIKSKESESLELRTEIETLKSGLAQEAELQKQIETYRNQINVLVEQQRKLQETVSHSEEQLRTLTTQLESEKHEREMRDNQIKRLEKLLDDTIKSTLTPPQVKKVTGIDIEKSKALPILTKIPNAISGVVFDKGGRFIVDGVVLIKNVTGQNLRALKTNQLGQFVAATSLPSGKYYVETSKSGHSFDIVEVNLVGGIVPPVEIRSHELNT